MDRALGGFVPDRAGIREIFTGPAMQAALGEVVDGLAAQADDIASTHHIDHQPVPPGSYYSNVYVGRNTAMGFVGPATHVGRLDQHIHHTLDAINH